MTYIKKALMLAVIIIIAAVGAAIQAFAESGTFLAAPVEVSEGEEFTLSVVFTADSRIGWAETNIVYDPDMLIYIEGSASGGNGILHLHDFPDNKTMSFSVPLKFKALARGTSEISLNNCVVSSPDGVPIDSSEHTLTIDIKEAVQSSASDSSDAESSETPSSADESGERVKGALKAMSVTGGKLAPEFSPDFYEYSVKADSDTDQISIYAEKTDITDYIFFKCSTWFDGEVTLTNAVVHLVEAETRVFITVTDDDDNEKVYRLTIYKDMPDSSDDTSGEAEQIDSSFSEQESVPAAVTDSSESSSAASSASEKSGVAELRDKLMPSLLIILGTLIVALIIIIVWIKSKSDRKRKKIKTTSGRK
ncbi:MAG: cadherin-like beta sandwich domain-containing protein [Ruminococcus sp.]|nr:cadherin-like beta sandwich domain-containing protein [Ruminococcus sp.]